MIITKVLSLIKPEKKLMIDTFAWYERGRFKAEEIKCKKSKKYIYVDSGFSKEKEKYFIYYYKK